MDRNVHIHPHSNVRTPTLMSKNPITPKLQANRATTLPPEPTDDVIRDYAYHLYEQGSCVPGHDVDNWLEAAACLKANIPAHSSHSRLY